MRLFVIDNSMPYKLGMATRCYLSNVSPLWTCERQEQALASALPGWPKGCTVFRDEVEPRKRRGYRPTSLVERGALLRETKPHEGGEDVYVASLAVLAWNAEDMMKCLTLAAARNARVHVLDAGLVIAPDSTAADLHQAAEAFEAARRADRDRYPGKISAEKRAAKAKAAADSIKPFWHLPSKDFPMDVLLAKAGISRNTAILYNGKRRPQQLEHERHQEAAEKRKATRDKKRKEAQEREQT